MALLAGKPEPKKKAAPKATYTPPPAAKLAGAPAAGVQAAYAALPASQQAPAIVAQIEAASSPAPAAVVATVATADMSVDTGEGSTYQQEIDILRGQVGTLNIVGLWTSADPPKVTGVWGRLLQGLMAGVSLRDAFAELNHAAAATRDNAAKMLVLVENHKTPTFTKPKGK